jgi:hypothetical protein
MLTKETINGKEYNVILKPFDADYVRDQLAMGMPVIGESEGRAFAIVSESERFAIQDETVWNVLYYGSGLEIYSGLEKGSWIEFIRTTLPPLPRHPKLEHQGLLHLYVAHGVDAWGEYFNNAVREYDTVCAICFYDGFPDDFKITHLTYNNQRIDDFAVAAY